MTIDAACFFREGGCDQDGRRLLLLLLGRLLLGGLLLGRLLLGLLLGGLLLGRLLLGLLLVRLRMSMKKYWASLPPRRG